MYAFLDGKIELLEQNSLALNVGGVGYRLYCPTRTLNAAKLGETARFHTRLIVREDGLSLYGFETPADKEMFGKLIAISGVGPKVALAILSAMRPEDIASAAISGNVAAFESVSGVGKKTAQRLALELRGKVDTTDAIGGGASGRADVAAEAVAALMGLGYAEAEALRAVTAVRALGDTAEDLVLLALKRLA